MVRKLRPLHTDIQREALKRIPRAGTIVLAELVWGFAVMNMQNEQLMKEAKAKAERVGLPALLTPPPHPKTHTPHHHHHHRTHSAPRAPIT